MELLRLVIPPLGIRYEEAFMPTRRQWTDFSLTKTQYSVAIAGRYQTLINSRHMLKSMAIPEKSILEKTAEQGPILALKELESIPARN